MQTYSVKTNNMFNFEMSNSVPFVNFIKCVWNGKSTFKAKDFRQKSDFEFVEDCVQSNWWKNWLNNEPDGPNEWDEREREREREK